ncbi:O-antigen polymerase [Vibrio splendidus]
MINRLMFIFSFLFLVFAIYGVNIQGIPIDIYRVFYLFSIAIIIFKFASSDFTYTIPKPWYIAVFFFLFSSIFVVLISIYTNSFEITFLRMNIDYIITLLIVSPVVCFFYLSNPIFRGSYEKRIIHLVLAIISFQALVMILMLIFPPIQKMVFSLISTNGAHVRYEGDFRFRAIGLTGFSSYSMAVCQCFGLYLFHILWSYKQSRYGWFLSVLSFLIIMISAVISARTSFVFIVPLFFYYVFLLFHSKSSILKYKISCVFFVFVILAFFLVSYLISTGSNEIERMLNWTFEIFYNFADTGKLATSSSNSLKDLFFLPTTSTILWGDGYYLLPSGEYYMHTDVGYLRVLLYGGLFGSLVFYSPFVYVYYLMFTSFKYYFGFFQSIPILIYCFLVFLVNVKGSIFFDGFNTQKIMFITVFAFLVAKRLEVKRNN